MKNNSSLRRFTKVLLFVVVFMFISGVQSLDFGTLKVIFGTDYIRRNQRFLQDPHSGYRNRKAFAREYGKHGSLFIKALSGPVPLSSLDHQFPDNPQLEEYPQPHHHDLQKKHQIQSDKI